MGIVWCAEEFGRGGIARYASDVASLLEAEGLDARVATTTGGPAEPTAVAHEVWFPRRGPGPVAKVVAAAGGISALRKRPGSDDVVWLPLGVRPRFEQAMVRAAAASGARTIATIHNRRPHDAEGGERHVLAAAHRVDLVVVHTAAMAAWAKEAGLSPVRLPFPPPQEAEHPAGTITRAALGLSQDDVVVALAGTLRPYKGVDVLLEALAQTPEDGPKVVLAGQIPDQDQLTAQVTDLDLTDRVRVVAGFLSGGELLDVLELADAIALPYRSIDHSGIGALAASRGLPAIGSDLPGVVELFGTAGRYAPPGDAPALARLLIDLPQVLRSLDARGVSRHHSAQLARGYASVVAPMVG